MYEVNNIKVKKDCVLFEVAVPEIRRQLSSTMSRVIPGTIVIVVIDRSALCNMLRELGGIPEVER